MSNTYFRFKKFLIQQENCALKVCTDACLFGAWVAQKMQERKAKSALDIGAGTGLLSLMLTQKNETAIIDAVEIDDAASAQASQNFEASPWHKSLHIFNKPVQDFDDEKKYDFIICNPPFYENNLKSNDEKRNMALHQNTLPTDELQNAFEKFLQDDGTVAVLLPFHLHETFEKKILKRNFFMEEKITVKQTEKHKPFRSILLFSRKEEKILKEELIVIKNEKNEYSKEFTALLKDYYLYL